MSWDSYLDKVIGYSKDAQGMSHCDRAAIIGLQGGAKYTTDAPRSAMKLTPQEAVNIARCFACRNNFADFQTNGVWAENKKYTFVRGDDNKTVIARGKGCGAVVLQSSKSAVVIGHSPEGSAPGNCNKGVAYIATYMEGQNM